ncbi:MAG: hypothetical protein KGD61_07645 [Candidatus Lokiarchaeota archaeon]|nr:hypothetical protein [Candidatus Lokiarchaeota archaeon]
MSQILEYLKDLKDLSDVIVFFDWDDTLVNPDYDCIIEPQVTQELIEFLIKNNVYFHIITGRFWNTACDETYRNLRDMEANIKNTMFPCLNQLGMDTSIFLKPVSTKNIYRIYDEAGVCVGIVYMGIFFSGQKGKTIKHYLRQTGLNKNTILFVDDYEPYLTETTSSFPKVQAFRRHVSYRAIN